MRSAAARVVVVPGLAVRRYVRPAVAALRDRGVDARLAPAPGEPGAPADLLDYGDTLAARLRPGPPVDLLVGLSVGAQAAARAATHPGAAGRLVLVSPTVDPAARSVPALLGRWLAGGRVEPPRLGLEQVPDWLAAGPRRVAAVVRSALAVHLESALADVPVPVTVVHAERDVVTSHTYAALLAATTGGRLVVVPGATHSWPFADADRFADLVTADLLG